MNRASERAMALAEEILDHVRYGLTRADALQELAEMIDEHNADLLQAANTLINDAVRRHGLVDPHYLSHLKQVVADHQPVPVEPEAQRDLFQAATPAPFSS